MVEQKTTITKRKKFIEAQIPLIKTRIELTGENLEEINNRTIKLDLTRQLKGKSIEAIFQIKIENNEAIAEPKKITLMPFFIRRMIRKKISYVEDSFTIPTQESLVRVKPFIITRKKVSRAVRKTLRNLAKNWIEDYFAERTDKEIFSEILSNKMQKPLSLKLKKTYPLSLCEIRVLEIIRPLTPSEIPKVEKKKQEIEEELDSENINIEIKEEKIKEAEEEIKKTQKKASEKQELEKEPSEETKEKPNKKAKKAPKKAKKENDN